MFRLRIILDLIGDATLYTEWKFLDLIRKSQSPLIHYGNARGHVEIQTHVRHLKLTRLVLSTKNITTILMKSTNDLVTAAMTSPEFMNSPIQSNTPNIDYMAC